MANVVNANTVYIDTTGDLSVGTNKNIKVAYIIVRAGAANARVELKDNQTSAVSKLDLSVVTAEETRYFDFSDFPVVFANGIDATITNSAVVTLILDRSA